MTNTRSPHDDDSPLPAVLASGLRALRDDLAPDRDLWPAIAARLEPRVRATGDTAAATAAPGPMRPRTDGAASAPQAPAPGTVAPRRDWRRYLRRRNAGYATAAAVVLAVAIAWQLLPVKTVVDPAADPANVVATSASAAGESPLLRAADALAREYQGAMREVQATTSDAARASEASATAATTPDGLDAELERSAAEVRAALARDPDALHLFHRLQRIYAHRLALSLRQA
ncbi:hypothetical protein [Luteimonas terricola]|uniref:Uncharacterized protein n=1 Tax=Luteimonas terricola TaxID=645597 RepID=A0ABQ2EEU0_9GAMM|nr:hypothetical protein [Luteimonas terricola]GGK08087.1 hypothetical protein GCM10011394_16780 [Luteimonas terricola]